MSLNSIMSYKDRGNWGDSNYRGNCSGYVIRDLLNHFKPRDFCEVFAGGGTGKEVALELGYTNSLHLDLNPRWGGWNALRDEMPSGSSFVFSHPAYHNIIEYSGNMWGKPHPDDLSRCESYDDFIQKLNLVNEKIYASLRRGGRMSILIGDVRKDGEYYPIFADMKRYGSLESIIIKEQHNMFSNKTKYSGRFIPIVHEYLVIFKKNDLFIVPTKFVVERQEDIRHYSFRSTWRDLVQATLESLGGKADLNTIYSAMENVERVKRTTYWKDKIRQTLNTNKDFESIERGYWKLRSA